VNPLRLLFLGDVVGAPGVRAMGSLLPGLRRREQIDAVIANAENATNGSGLSPKDYRLLRNAGIDAMTLGDHAYKKQEIAGVMQTPVEPICKPANFPSEAPGRECIRLVVAGVEVVVISLLGRTFMRPVDCPFAAADRVLKALGPSVKVILVDVHAEATAEKYLLLHHLKGRVSAVLGTHTHIATADEQIFPGGTAFQCDVGMCGPYDSILGRRIDRVLSTAVTFVPSSFDVAAGDVRLSGAIVDVDAATGRASAIRRIQVKEGEA
jgi:metallophosphoesterase (TIGR00282 family)